jgi:hypothetical protein
MRIDKNRMRSEQKLMTRIWVVLPLLFVLLATSPARGQEVVDKTVATVSDGARTQLITYSDLMWQLALQPGVQLDSPRSEDLNRALETIINQRIFALEAKRLPQSIPSEKEIAAKIIETLAFFPSPSVFASRLKQVGFDSVKDPAFEDLIAQRLSIDKYVTFRFGSFVVVTPEEDAKYYRDTYVPDFRRRFPGVVVPSFEDTRKEIREILEAQKIATSIERFLDEAKRRVRIEILIDV